MPRQALRRIDIVKQGDGWIAKDKTESTFAEARTKRDIVRDTAAKARKSAEPTTVRIHGTNGRVQQERTYPRSADPTSSKG